MKRRTKIHNNLSYPHTLNVYIYIGFISYKIKFYIKQHHIEISRILDALHHIRLTTSIIYSF